MVATPRSLFEAISELGHDMDFEPLLIPTPTGARPGSTEKLLVLKARLEAVEDLYHDGDARIAATAESQALLAAFAIQHAADERDANRNAKNEKVKDNWKAARAALARKKQLIRKAPARKRA